MSSEKSMRQQFAETMLDVGVSDSRLVVVVGDISSGIMQPFAEACSGRFFNIGILEQSMLSVSAGMSKVGLIPVVHTIAPFLIERAFEQLKLDFSYQKLGGNIVSIGGGFDYSNLGCTHHCYGDFALFKTLENTEIIYPASPVEFDELFRQTYDNGNLTYFRLPSENHGSRICRSDITLGKGLNIKSGDDLTIIATGPHLSTAKQIHKLLEERQIRAEVLYLPIIKPLDVELIRDSLSKTNKAVVIEEHMRSGGVGDDILRATSDIASLGFISASIPDVFVRSYGSYHELRNKVGLTPHKIFERILSEFFT